MKYAAQTIAILVLMGFGCGLGGDEFEEITLTHLDTWGGVETDGQGLLGYPSDFLISSQGEIVVTDVRLNQVLFFSKSGDLIRRVGRPGNKPLEFAIPDDIAQVGDRLVVWDYQNNRLQFLSLDGAFHEMSVPEPRIDFNSKTFDSMGRLHYATNGFRADSLVYVYSSDGEFIKTYGQLAGDKFSDYDVSRLRQIAQNRQIPDAVKNSVLLCATSHDEIFMAHTALPLLKKYTIDGRKVFEVQLKDADFEVQKNTFFATNDTLPDFSFKPLRFWNDIVADADGGVLLLHSNIHQLVVSHFNTDGKLIRKYNGPAINVSRIYLDGDELWAIGRQNLVFYRFSIQPQESLAANE